MPSITFFASTTWPAPDGVHIVSSQCTAGGGGGAGAATTEFGGGGAGGESAAELANTCIPGTVYTVTVGAAGTAGTSGGTNGGAGGNSSFSGTGATTVTAHGGGGGHNNGLAGTAGTGSSNSVHHDGGAGGTSGSKSDGGGGGGGSGGTSAAGNAGGNSTTSSPGTAAPAVTGGGPGGAGGANAAAGSAPVSGPGGGGGGAGGISSGGNAGGAGSAGQVTLTWTSPTAPGSPLIPPSPFTPMTLRHWQPPTGPSLVFTGHGALAPLAGIGDQSPPVFTGTGALAPFSAAAAAQYAFPFPQDPLGIKAEVLINGTWADITQFVQQRDDIVIGRGRPDETGQVTPSQVTLTVNNNDGRFSLNNPAGAFAPYFTRNTQLRISLNTWSADFTQFTGFRFWGEVSTVTPQWDPSGNDRYAAITASGALRRFSQGNANIGSAMRRYYGRLPADQLPYGYWPGEDADGATEIGSAVNGVPAMGFTGQPSFGADSSFGGSDPIPAVNSSAWHGQTLAASHPPGAGSLTESTPGTYSFTCPPGVEFVTVPPGGIIGGGAGGGASGTTMGGGGGGGGGSAGGTTAPMTAGVTYRYTVGAGGSAGTTPGTQGHAGTASSITGDGPVTVAGPGGQPGIGGDVSTGGAGGAAGPGGFAGGRGSDGFASTTGAGSEAIFGNSGTTGGGDGGTAEQQSISWPCPDGVTSVTVQAGAGGGGGEGGGAGSGAGGGGAGGGGWSSGTIDTTPGNSYDFLAGNGGNGNTSGAHGDAGADSLVTGDTTTVIAHGGGAGSGSGSPGPGGSGTVPGSSGGFGHGNSASGGGGGGGGGGGNANGTGSSSTGRQPGGGGGNGSGGGWGATTLGNAAGSSAGGGGGSGGNSSGDGSSGGGGGGGGGAVSNNSGKAGGGGGGGFIQWEWLIPDAPAAGGGGSSGGSGSAGSDATSPVGADAVAGGGAGGSQGKPGVIPGGGGGGGYPPAAAGGAITPPGPGAAGQVAFSWTGGTVSPVAADIIRFLLSVQDAGGTDLAVLARIVTFGDVEHMDLLYRTGGGLELIGYDSGGTVLFDSGNCAFGVDGKPVMVDIELTNDNAGGATYMLAAIEPAAVAPVATFGGHVASVSVGFASDVFIGPNSDVGFASAGQLTVQTYADPLTSLAAVIDGYSGELAADRLARLCAEEGLTFTLVGENTDTPQMGPQQDDTLVNVFQSAEDLDRGQVYEPRDSFGIAYRTRVSMQGQNPAVILDYSLAQLGGTDDQAALRPVTDDQWTRNDITVTRNNGSSSTAALTSGPMSTASPPNGVGDYPYPLTVQAFSDGQLPNLAAWMLSVGTVNDERYPAVPVNLARSEVVSLFSQIAAVDIGDFVQVANPPSWLRAAPISQLCWGMTETLNAFKWTISWNAVPEAPYAAGNQPAW